jgi:K+-transporting ATPase ATPase C chain
MRTYFRPAITLFLLFTLLTGAIYPVAITVLAQTIFPHRANGSILEPNGQAIGSELIGQQFDDPRYFWGRPSATEKVPYDAALSSGSNLGPTNDDLLNKIKERVEAIRQAHPDLTGPIPADLVTASASGLDPHISPAAAQFQVTRVAKVRSMSKDRIQELINANTEGREFGVLGEPRVNVLRLNLALDQLTGLKGTEARSQKEKSHRLTTD